MPFKSKAMARKFFAMESAGEIPEGTAERWAHHTKSIKDLPEHVKKKKTASVAAVLLKIAGDSGDNSIYPPPGQPLVTPHDRYSPDAGDPVYTPSAPGFHPAPQPAPAPEAPPAAQPGTPQPPKRSKSALPPKAPQRSPGPKRQKRAGERLPQPSDLDVQEVENSALQPKVKTPEQAATPDAEASRLSHVFLGVPTKGVPVKVAEMGGAGGELTASSQMNESGAPVFPPKNPTAAAPVNALPEQSFGAQGAKPSQPGSPSAGSGIKNTI